MRKRQAALGSAVFFLIAPWVVAGAVPWWITHLSRRDLPPWLSVPTMLVGGGLILVGVVMLVRAFVRFVNEGRGTPAPVAPTERLAVGAEYDTYHRAVRGWWPRLRPWDPSRTAGTNS